LLFFFDCVSLPALGLFLLIMQTTKDSLLCSEALLACGKEQLMSAQMVEKLEPTMAIICPREVTVKRWFRIVYVVSCFCVVITVMIACTLCGCKHKLCNFCYKNEEDSEPAQ
jgi:hypothetical protein